MSEINQVEVTGTVVNGVTSPSLEYLMSNKCTKAELQAALVQLIQIVNLNQIEFRKWANLVDDKLSQKQNKQWRATM